jgi:hypothetical protein
MADSTGARFAFMDATEAAAHLKTDRLAILDYIKQGKLKTFGGKPSNPFVRTEDVLKLAEELQIATEEEAIDPKNVHRNDPVRKVKLRIQQDAKWTEVDEAAIRAWAVELDKISYPRMRQVAVDAIAQLEKIMAILDEVEAKSKG